MITIANCYDNFVELAFEYMIISIGLRKIIKEYQNKGGLWEGKGAHGWLVSEGVVIETNTYTCLGERQLQFIKNHKATYILKYADHLNQYLF